MPLRTRQMLKSGANWNRLDSGNAMSAILALATPAAKFAPRPFQPDSVLSLH